jgi:hypothetical protein
VFFGVFRGFHAYFTHKFTHIAFAVRGGKLNRKELENLTAVVMNEIECCFSALGFFRLCAVGAERGLLRRRAPPNRTADTLYTHKLTLKKYPCEGLRDLSRPSPPVSVLVSQNKRPYFFVILIASIKPLLDYR